jgi:hypothetical protein
LPTASRLPHRHTALQFTTEYRNRCPACRYVYDPQAFSVTNYVPYTDMTKLDKPLRREIDINGEAHVLVISPEGLKLTVKGKRRGQEITWASLVSADAALAPALNASLDAADE